MAKSYKGCIVNIEFAERQGGEGFSLCTRSSKGKGLNDYHSTGAYKVNMRDTLLCVCDY